MASKTAFSGPSCTSWVAPDLMGAGPEAIWRGMATVAGSWIGGSANQTALYEIYGAGPDTFSIWIAVDVVVANIWMAVVLFTLLEYGSPPLAG